MSKSFVQGKTYRTYCGLLDVVFKRYTSPAMFSGTIVRDARKLPNKANRQQSLFNCCKFNPIPLSKQKTMSTKQNTTSAKPTKITIELTPRQAFTLWCLSGRVSSPHISGMSSVYAELSKGLNANAFQFPEEVWKIPAFSQFSEPFMSKYMTSLGFENVQPKRTKMPDGKFAPKNYRKVLYPKHGYEEDTVRHVLLGEFLGNGNIAVKEWNASTKEWSPKTFTVSKITPAS